MLTPETRRYIYGIVTAALPMLITMGALSEGLTQQIMLFVGAVLGVATPALANANVSKPETPVTPAPSAELPQGPIVS
jgi:hypothetical protein